MRWSSRLRLSTVLPALLLLLGTAARLRADAPAFDLTGPKVDVHVQRGGKTLPIAQVPNLLPGDRLWIHPDLPESQSAHYILIVAFLRGATNPPPVDWFKRVETWNKSVRQEGVFVVVPAEAQQAVLFLAPETGGDFTTLRNAVRGRPGAFVRATQDLQQASWDRMRLDAYLAEVKALTGSDPKTLKERTELAARSLGMRVEQQCFDKPTEQQAPCLVQHTDGLVLDDANAQTLVSQIANGSTADLMNQLSYSSLGGAGQFSPYVGAVVDMVRILSTVHTAKYQYIPALAMPLREQPDTLNLRLNVPPSFRDPKSVIVVALPPVAPARPLVMHAANPGQTYCAPKPGLIFAADGAPLVFATGMAHDLVLHIDNAKGEPAAEPQTAPALDTKKPAPTGLDVAVRAEPSLGGFVPEKALPTLPDKEQTGSLRGKWGFDDWEGPKFKLQSPKAGGWTIPASDLNTLITGREDTVHVQGQNTLCIADVTATLPDSGKSVNVAWKAPRPDELELTVPLKDSAPGTVTISIHQYGLGKADELELKAYAEAASLEHFHLSAGDRVAMLKGKRLDEVARADLAGITFTPSALNRVQDHDQLDLAATGVTTTLQPGDGYLAKVTLRDGRTLQVPATVEVMRPQIELVSKGVQHDEAADADPNNPNAQPPIRLGSPDDLPLQRKLVFFLRSRVPASFARTEKVEIAAVDGSFGTTLSLADGSLMLEDAKTAVAVVDPMARFGASAFGPIQLRAITADGVTGDWVPLGTLIRLPGIAGGPASKELRCPRSAAKPCTLSGTNLFLITEVSVNSDMSNAVEVPGEFMGASLAVPNQAKPGPSATLYLKLRDDPATVHTLNLPITAIPSATGPAAGSDSAAKPETKPDPKPDAKSEAPAPSGIATSAPH